MYILQCSIMLPVVFISVLFAKCAPKIIAFVGNFYIDLTKLLQEPVLLVQSQIQRLSLVLTSGSAS